MDFTISLLQRLITLEHGSPYLSYLQASYTADISNSHSVIVCAISWQVVGEICTYQNNLSYHFSLLIPVLKVFKLKP